MKTLKTFLLLSLCLSLCACPPVRDGGETGDDDDDDDDDIGGGTLEEIWESLSPGSCAVLPEDSGLLAEGAGRATSGLWYDVACIGTGGNASEVFIEPEWFDEQQGGEFAGTNVRAVAPGGSQVVIDGDFGALTLMPGTWGLLNGWWEGELRGFNEAGLEVQLEAIVWRDTQVEPVVGR